MVLSNTLVSTVPFGNWIRPIVGFATLGDGWAGPGDDFFRSGTTLGGYSWVLTMSLNSLTVSCICSPLRNRERGQGLVASTVFESQSCKTKMQFMCLLDMSGKRPQSWLRHVLGGRKK